MLTACQAKEDLAARLGRLGIAYEKLTARTIGFGDLARSRDSAPTANVAPLFVKVVGLKRFPIPDWVTLKKEAAAVGYCIETPLEL